MKIIISSMKIPLKNKDPSMSFRTADDRTMSHFSHNFWGGGGGTTKWDTGN